ncbi:MAG: cupin domain-containing protein [Pirellulaceae bacterium]
MPTFINAPAIVMAAGNKPKQIQEFVGRVNTSQEDISIARMISPSGWREPAQQPEFAEISIVLRGMLRVEAGSEVFDVRGGQAILTRAGERVRYSTPEEDGAEYIAVCLPAFSPETVHRIEE